MYDMASPKYPTKSQILSAEILHTYDDALKLTSWKFAEYYGKWKRLSIYDRTEAIFRLFQSLVPHAAYMPSNAWAADIDKQIIYYQPKNPSIISALHEIGHLKHGPSELNACVYSIRLFAYVFPKEYTALTWSGHMLKKH